MPQGEKMRAPEHKALTTIRINVPRERREDFRKWHNCEHSTDRMMGPGFQVLHRYNAVDDAEHHDMVIIFEGDSLDAFSSEYYMNSLNNPTPWTRESMKFIKDAERTVYLLQASCGEEPGFDAPYAYTVRLNSTGAPGAGEELAAWYEEEHLPRLCGVPGVLRGRLFKRVDELSSIKTAEQKIQGTGMGDCIYMCYLELDSLDNLGTSLWTEAAFGTPRSEAMRGKLMDLQRERWSLGFTRWTPERKIADESNHAE